jgi:hypothetical protein
MLDFEISKLKQDNEYEMLRTLNWNAKTTVIM